LIQTATAKALAHASNIISAKAGGNKTFYNKNVLLPKLGFFIPTGCGSVHALPYLDFEVPDLGTDSQPVGMKNRLAVPHNKI
jgi:hypothetical protein